MNEEDKIIDVNMSCIEVASEDRILRSVGIGSCIVITLYDPRNKVGAMAHPMLDESDKHSFKNPLRFVDSSIDVMIKELKKFGSVKNCLEAKIVGGANMFETSGENFELVGSSNIEATKKKLGIEGIKIIASDTGGSVGRSVEFDVSTGIVEVRTKL
jgi:chemotaxis protein CheD